MKDYFNPISHSLVPKVLNSFAPHPSPFLKSKIDCFYGNGYRCNICNSQERKRRGKWIKKCHLHYAKFHRAV